VRRAYDETVYQLRDGFAVDKAIEGHDTTEKHPITFWFRAIAEVSAKAVNETLTPG
jgi:hypothetical protein